MEPAPCRVDARGMRCPWPVLRAARALRSHDAVLIEADDAMAEGEIAALAAQNNWHFERKGTHIFSIRKQA